MCPRVAPMQKKNMWRGKEPTKTHSFLPLCDDTIDTGHDNQERRFKNINVINIVLLSYPARQDARIKIFPIFLPSLSCGNAYAQSHQDMTNELSSHLQKGKLSE